MLQTSSGNTALNLTPGSITANSLTVTANNLAALNAVTAGSVVANVVTANALGANSFVANGVVSANNITSVYTTAQGGGTAVYTGLVSVPLAGDHSQAWFKISSNAAFTAGLTTASDGASANYVSGLTISTANTAGTSIAPVSPVWSNGVIVMSNCAPGVTHSLAVRSLGPAGVFQVSSFGSLGANTVYSISGSVLYTGSLVANAINMTFYPLANVKYGVQQLNYS